MVGQRFLAKISSEGNDNTTQIFTTHHHFSSSLLITNNRLYHIINPTQLTRPISYRFTWTPWIDWLENDEMKVMRTIHKPTTILPLSPQSLLPS